MERQRKGIDGKGTKKGKERRKGREGKGEKWCEAKETAEK